MFLIVLNSLTTICIIFSVSITEPYFDFKLYPDHGPLTAFIDFITILSLFLTGLNSEKQKNEIVKYFVIMLFFCIYIPKLIGFKYLLEELNNNILAFLFGILYLFTVISISKKLH